MKTKHLFKYLLTATLMCVAASAQTPPGGRYVQDGLSFSYPTGWTLTDKSNAQAQHLILTRDGGSALVVVIAYRELIVSPGQLAAAHHNLWRPFALDMARKLGVERNPPWEDTQCQQVGERSAVGVRLSGRLEGQPTTGEVYALALGRRFVIVFFVRHDRDEAQESPAWKTLLASLKVEDHPNLPPIMISDEDAASVGVLNGKALTKPQPQYPLSRGRRERRARSPCKSWWTRTAT
ncbi:MAG: hypothetical protein LC802_06325 [Acidobacteria bacterium]|nr:hypothetical protein [Acidobacteriota bacterium]